MIFVLKSAVTLLPKARGLDTAQNVRADESVALLSPGSERRLPFI